MTRVNSIKQKLRKRQNRNAKQRVAQSILGSNMTNSLNSAVYDSEYYEGLAYLAHKTNKIRQRESNNAIEMGLTETIREGEVSKNILEIKKGDKYVSNNGTISKLDEMIKLKTKVTLGEKAKILKEKGEPDRATETRESRSRRWIDMQINNEPRGLGNEAGRESTTSIEARARAETASARAKIESESESESQLKITPLEEDEESAGVREGEEDNGKWTEVGRIAMCTTKSQEGVSMLAIDELEIGETATSLVSRMPFQQSMQQYQSSPNVTVISIDSSDSESESSASTLTTFDITSNIGGGASR